MCDGKCCLVVSYEMNYPEIKLYKRRCYAKNRVRNLLKTMFRNSCDTCFHHIVLQSVDNFVISTYNHFINLLKFTLRRRRPLGWTESIYLTVHLA
jgi:hypothetical protein